VVSLLVMNLRHENSPEQDVERDLTLAAINIEPLIFA
jgi:hypothetical protein